jgi:hypothetical protein
MRELPRNGSSPVVDERFRKSAMHAGVGVTHYEGDA